MLRKSVTTLAIVFSLGLAPFSAIAQDTTQQAGAQPSAQAANPFDFSAWFNTGTTGGQQSGSVNWFDPATWMGGMGGQMQGVPQFNLAHPAGWSIFMNPSTYAAMMNPATYGQFMSPQFYMQFMDPNNWMAWMNPAAYGPWLNPGTYMQWMNPMAYMQFMNPMTYMQWMNPGNYMAFMNPATYMQWMNPAAYAIPGSQGSGDATAFNWFDPNTWANMMAPQGAGSANPGQATQ